jgi:aminoglycoside 3-N-acetyltransferase
MASEASEVVTRSRLVAELRRLGVAPGQTVMLHVSVKSVGWVVGGPDVVLDALLEVLTPTGTLMMYVGWEDDTTGMDEWPLARRQAYLAERPPFDPVTAHAHRGWSILTEYLRIRPDARRSNHPEASMAAIGSNADWLVDPHSLRWGYGPESPLGRLVACGGHVLVLGSPLGAITLLHHAEHLADLPDKRIERHRYPVLSNGKRVWVDVEQYDTGWGIVDHIPAEEYFPMIARLFLATGQGQAGRVGNAESYLFPAAKLTSFAVKWMEQNLVTP